MTYLNRFFCVGLVVLFSQPLYAGLEKPKKTIEIGVVLRLKDKFNDTIAGINMGIDTAKALYEKLYPETQVVLHRIPHGDGFQAVVDAAKIVIGKKLTAVIGGELSEEVFFLKDQFKNRKIVLITPTASNPEITTDSSFTFRMCASDQGVVSELAQYTFRHLKPSSIGVLHNVSSLYTDYLSQQFINEFDQLQQKYSSRIPIYEEKVIRDTLSFEEAIQNFMAKKVTHVMIPSHPTEFLRFVTQAEEKGFFPVYVGSDGWGSNEHVYRHLVLDSKKGARFIGVRGYFWKEDVETEIGKQFQTEYRAKFKMKPTAWSALGFDSAWLMITTMSKVSDPSRGDLIKNELEKTQNLELVTQKKFAFGKDHSPVGNVPIYQIDRKGIYLQRN